jgi:hypothetical protein
MPKNDRKESRKVWKTGITWAKPKLTSDEIA